MQMQIPFSVCLGVVTAIIAAGKGRSAIGWFFIGALFPIIGLILAIVVSNPSEEKRFRGQSEDENRRLREQLRQTRMRLEQMQHETHGRLSRIDQHLGIDTTIPQLASEASVGDEPHSGSTPPSPVPSAIAPVPERVWYYEQAGETRGPVNQDVLRALLATGQLRPSNLVWSQHMPDWRPASDTPEFRQLA